MLMAQPSHAQPDVATSPRDDDAVATENKDIVRVFEDERPLIGADISWAPSQEARGTVFSDRRVEKDVLEILADNKFNWIGLRLFVDPTAERGYSKEGYCGLEQTLAMAKRIKAAGMKFLLDFHYSDTWADPGKQFTPKAWQGLSDAALQEKVYQYTRDVIKRFKDEGVTPEMIQIGNEIHNGMLWPQGRFKESPEMFCTLLERASEAVRDVDANIKIMVHVALGGDNKRSVAFYDTVLSHGVVFDVIGQSYYPKHHGTLEDLNGNLTDLATRYNKPIVVVEYQEHPREVNEIVRDLPNGLGWGTFIWEATSDRWGGLFDRNGATTEKMAVYPAIFDDYRSSD
jgi:arabinogalactan endo-1,4-beta-galactosidase